MLDRSIPPKVYTLGQLSLPVPVLDLLPNGIPLRSLRGGSQEVIQLSLVWSGGCAEASNVEIAKLMASLLTEGTASLSGAQISEIIDFNGAILRVNADQHVTTLTLTAINSMIAEVLPVVLDVICNPSFDSAKFDTFRDMAVKNLLMQKSKVSVVANEALDPLIFGRKHPKAAPDTPEIIEAISVDDVKDFYLRLITADTCKAYIGGNFDEATYNKVRDMVAAIPTRGRGLAKVVVPFHAEAPERVTVEKPDAVQAAVCMGIPAIDRSHPDYVPLRFSVIALGGYFGSRLMKNIREDKGYTYGIASYLLGSQEGSYVAVFAQTDKCYVDLVIDEVGKEMLRLASQPMPDDELMRLRQHISSSLMEILDSPFSIIDHYRTVESVGLPNGYFDAQVEWAHRLDASTIMAMAAKYLQPSKLRVAVCV